MADGVAEVLLAPNQDLGGKPLAERIFVKALAMMPVQSIGGRKPFDPANDLGIGIRKEDAALKDMIQKTLDEMFKDGTMKKISIKWFGDDITSWK